MSKDFNTLTEFNIGPVELKCLIVIDKIQEERNIKLKAVEDWKASRILLFRKKRRFLIGPKFFNSGMTDDEVWEIGKKRFYCIDNYDGCYDREYLTQKHFATSWKENDYVIAKSIMASCKYSQTGKIFVSDFAVNFLGFANN